MWTPPPVAPPFNRRRFVLALEDGSALVLDDGERLRMETPQTDWDRGAQPATGWQDVPAAETTWT